MILGIQLLGVVFVSVMVYITFIHFKRKTLTQLEHLFWQTVWVLFGAIVLFPSVVMPLVTRLDVGRAMDLFTILGFVFVLGVVFANYLSIRKTKHKVEEAISALAMQKPVHKK